jgi:hypothetical protein
MKKMTDDELQQWLESGRSMKDLSTGQLDQTDLAVYEWLFSELSKVPAAGLSYGFAEKTGRKAKQQYYRMKDRRLYAMVAVICCIALLAIAACLIMNLSAFVLLVSFMSQYKWIFLFAITFFCLFQWLDMHAKEQSIHRIRNN